MPAIKPATDGLTLAAALLLVAVYLSSFDLIAVVLSLVAVCLTAYRVAATGRLRWFGAVASAFGLYWILYAAAVGSLPAPGDSWRFAASEARVLLSFVPVILMATAVNPSEAREALVRSFRLIAWGGPLLVALFVAFPGLVADHAGLLHGLSSSHHVPGFMYGVVALLLLYVPTLYPRPITRIGLFGAALVVVALSGSRASMAGLLMVAVVTLLVRGWREPGRRSRVLFFVGAASLIVVLLAPRSAESFLAVARSDFRDAVGVAFRSGDEDTARSLGSERAADANVLIRFALYSNALATWMDSPLLGGGAFRSDDAAVEGSGVRGFVFPLTTGERRHTDQQAHNMMLYLLAEGGLLAATLIVGLWLIILWRLYGAVRLRPGGERAGFMRAGAAAVIFGFATCIVDMGFLTPGLAVPVGLLACGAMAFTDPGG